MNYYNYFSEIEEAFIRRRGRNLLLSPLDWALIETWQERGIPLRIVLRGIEKVFDGVDKQPAQKRGIKSLIYCREEIEAQYEDWLTTQVGKKDYQKAQTPKSETQNSEDTNLPKNDLFSAEAIDAHFEKTLSDLKKALKKADGELRKTIEIVLENLAKLRQNPQTVEALEKSLEKLDSTIDASLLKSFEIEKLTVEIEKQIASYKNKMEREVYRRTIDLMLLKRLREQTEIPRLSLFYL